MASICGQSHISPFQGTVMLSSVSDIPKNVWLQRHSAVKTLSQELFPRGQRACKSMQD